MHGHLFKIFPPWTYSESQGCQVLSHLLQRGLRKAAERPTQLTPIFVLIPRSFDSFSEVWERKKLVRIQVKISAWNGTPSTTLLQWAQHSAGHQSCEPDYGGPCFQRQHTYPDSGESQSEAFLDFLPLPENQRKSRPASSAHLGIWGCLVHTKPFPACCSQCPPFHGKAEWLTRSHVLNSRLSWFLREVILYPKPCNHLS